MNLKKINKKQTNKNKDIYWLDRLVLNTKNFRTIVQILMFIIVILLIVLVVNELVLKQTLAYIPLLAITIAGTVILFLLTVLLSFLKGHRYNHFNKGDYTQLLFNHYLTNPEVKDFQIPDLPKPDGSLQVSSWIPNAYKFIDNSKWLKLEFKNEKTLGIEYFFSLYQSPYRKDLINVEGNVKKIVVVKCASVSKNTFYFAGETFNFADDKNILVNNLKLVAQGKTESFHVYGLENEDYDHQQELDFDVIDQFLFNPSHTSRKYDFFNTPTASYLIATAPLMFMNSKLELHESISNFAENLRRQAGYDIVFLQLLANLKTIIDTQLLNNKKVSEGKTLDQPEIKSSESIVKIN
ncbi:hypothetical protein [[Mycoplasma] testudinis]|uniref:hypothetical protein n=1 Tax=[Mycoplasma] testudinis TaxID=33924 RepID=UPI000482DA78|nr:hypothetical protein [[Mycoplasma] testudinis]